MHLMTASWVFPTLPKLVPSFPILAHPVHDRHKAHSEPRLFKAHSWTLGSPVMLPTPQLKWRNKIPFRRQPVKGNSATHSPELPCFSVEIPFQAFCTFKSSVLTSLQLKCSVKQGLVSVAIAFQRSGREPWPSSSSVDGLHKERPVPHLSTEAMPIQSLSSIA